MLWWISFFNYADRQAVTAVFKRLREEMNLTDVELGLLGSSFALVYGLCAPFAGTIVDRVRRKTAILGGLQAWSIICLATAWSRNFYELLFFRAAEGLGETFYYPASTSMISDYHGKSTRSRALGIHQTSVYIGTIAGSSFAGLIADYYSWRSSFITFGALGVLLGVVLSRFLFEPRRGAADFTASSVSQQLNHAQALPLREVLNLLWATPTALLLMLAFLCANFVAMVLLIWMPDYLSRNFHLSLYTAGLTATVYAQLASMCGAFLGGWLADGLRQRMSSGRVLVQAVGVLAGAPFVFLCGQTQSVVWLAAGLAAWGLFKGIYDANIFASVFDVIPVEARGTVAGCMNMVGWLGGGVTGPLAIGLIATYYGLGPAISSAALVYIAAGIALLVASLRFVKRDVARVEP
jgi:MFS family permease